MTKKKKRKKPISLIDPHLLYEASVQNVDLALNFIERVFRARSGRALQSLREDFSGTTQMACDWVKRGKDHVAYGIEIDPKVITWAHANNVCRLDAEARGRVTIIEADVLTVETPRVDVITAFNFSFAVFKERQVLLHYFKHAHAGLRQGGLFVLDCFAGSDMMNYSFEPKRIPAHCHILGQEIPEFTYTWEQEKFNLIDYGTVCHIHFKIPGFKKMKRAFTYNWRLWSIAELSDLLKEAGFETVDVYADSWVEEEGDTDGVYRRRKNITDMSSIIPYLVAG